MERLKKTKVWNIGSKGAAQLRKVNFSYDLKQDSKYSAQLSWISILIWLDYERAIINQYKIIFLVTILVLKFKKNSSMKNLTQ